MNVLQENLETVAGDTESEEEARHGKRFHVDDDELSKEEEKEQQEVKKIRIDVGETSYEGLSRAKRSSSSSSLSSVDQEAKLEASSSNPKTNDILKGNNNDNGRLSAESRQLPWRIETGFFSQIPPELLFHILKFLSSEVSRLVFVCVRVIL